MGLLAEIGLIEWVAHLVESDDVESEIIHPLSVAGGNRQCAEDAIGEAAHAAGAAGLTEAQRAWAVTEALTLVPVPHHLGRVQVVGIARLRYRPKTKLTAAWRADLKKNGQVYVRRYREMIPRAMRQQPPDRHATSR